MHTFFRIHKCQISEVYDISSLLFRVIHPYVYCVKDKLDFIRTSMIFWNLMLDVKVACEYISILIIKK